MSCLVKFLIRGAVLLPFFLSVNLSASDTFTNFYTSLYKTMPQFSSWVKKERNNVEKDIFLSLYNLPSSRKRVFRHRLPSKFIENYSSEKKISYYYIKTNHRISFKLIFAGIKRGHIKINGKDSGVIRLKKSRNYAKAAVTLEKGIYFFSITVEEMFPGFPMTVLSDKRLKFSKDKGFNRNAKSSMKLYNITKNSRSEDDIFLHLYNRLCFPFNFKSAESDENSYYSLFTTDIISNIKDKPLIELLAVLPYNSEVGKFLIKKGFSKDEINWWKSVMNSGRVCR